MSNANYNKLIKALTTRANAMPTQSRGKGKGKGNGRRSSRATATRTVVSGDGSALQGHWKMLSDPCAATLAESSYRGTSGYTSRFSRTWTIASAGNNAYLYVGVPSALAAIEIPTNSTSAAIAPAYGGAMAGQAFVAANANNHRVIGYCLEIDYMGTELNRSGKLYTGTVPATFVEGGAWTTLDGIKSTLSNATRTPDHQLESKWFPGVGNERYAKYNDLNESFADDNSALVFIAEAMPDGVQLQFRETIVIEWLPKPALGFTLPSTLQGHNPVGAYEKLHSVASKDPSFFHSFKEGASKRATSYAYSAGRGFVDLAAGSLRALGARAVRTAVTRAAPMLLMAA